jgi:hypothetical protein
MPTTTGCLTNFSEQKLLDHLLRNTSWTMPTCFFALWQGSPTDTGAGSSEVTTPGTNGYARIAVGTGGSSKFAAAASRAITTNADIVWGPSTGGPWGTVSFWALMDASTGGNVLAYGDLTDSTIGTDDKYKILAGNLTLSFTAGSKWTDALLNLMLDHLVGRTAWTSPSTWLALFEGDPLGAGVETDTPGSNGYARQDLDAAMSAASGGSIQNGSVITFGPDTTTNWGTSDYYAVFTASTGSTPIGGALLTASKTISVGDSGEVAAGALVFTLD